MMGTVGTVPLGEGEPARQEPLTAAEITEYVVTAAVWAPSVHNTQPWRFTADGQQISLYADTARQLRVADPDGREMMISCGAAAALHTQPLEFTGLRETIRTGLSDGAYPQLVLRFGTVIQAADSVRRPPDDVLSTDNSEDSDTGDG